MSPLSLISVFICFGNNKTHYSDRRCRSVCTCTQTVTFAVAVWGASALWQGKGKSSERPPVSTWMLGGNPVIRFPSIHVIRVDDFKGFQQKKTKTTGRATSFGSFERWVCSAAWLSSLPPSGALNNSQLFEVCVLRHGQSHTSWNDNHLFTLLHFLWMELTGALSFLIKNYLHSSENDWNLINAVQKYTLFYVTINLTTPKGTKLKPLKSSVEFSFLTTAK